MAGLKVGEYLNFVRTTSWRQALQRVSSLRLYSNFEASAGLDSHRETLHLERKTVILTITNKWDLERV